MKQALWLLAGTLFASPALAEDTPVETLASTGRWEMNYDADSCHLISNFGSGDAQVTAMFTRYQPGDPFELKLFGKRFERGGAVRVPVTTDFASDGTTFRGDALRGNAGELPLLVVGKRYLVEWQGEAPPAISPEQERSVRSVTVQVGRGRPFRLALGSMAAPMNAMRTCTANLVRSWGFDPAEQAGLSRQAVPLNDPAQWLDGDDFPNSANLLGQNGIVQFRLAIEADGAISNCAVQSATAGSDFATTTCRAVTRRARFQPALNAAGQPVRSYYVQAVRWLAFEG
jgi:hypothetical protein